MNAELKQEKVFWTDQERDFMAQYILEGLNKNKVPTDNYQVTTRAIHKASIEMLPEYRYRNHLSTQDVTDMQSRFETLTKESRISHIVSIYTAYVKLWNMSPIEHATKLAKELEETVAAYSALQVKYHKITGTGKASETPAKLIVYQKKASLPIFVCFNHYTDQQKREVESKGSVLWLSDKDNDKAIRSKAHNRHVFVIHGQLNSTLARVAKKAATSFVEFEGGFTKLVSLIDQKIASLQT